MIRARWISGWRRPEYDYTFRNGRKFILKKVPPNMWTKANPKPEVDTIWTMTYMPPSVASQNDSYWSMDSGVGGFACIITNPSVLESFWIPCHE